MKLRKVRAYQVSNTVWITRGYINCIDGMYYDCIDTVFNPKFIVIQYGD